MDDAFIDQDADLAPPRRRSPKLAPIGTRPTSQISAHSLEKPKLNPAAPSFKIPLFNRDKKLAEEGEKGDKNNKKGKGKKESPKDRGQSDNSAVLEPSSPGPPLSHDTNDISPPDGRFSKDGAPSISTFDTASEPRTSLELTPSRTSELVPKETFMQKLSRKSSASMFNFPSFGGSKDKARFASAKRAQVASSSAEFVGTPDETDEESKGGLSPLIGATSAGREAKYEKEKFSFRRSLTGRRKGEKAPSIQESVASETGDEVELDEAEKEHPANAA
jgi:hypothetical protein